MKKPYILAVDDEELNLLILEELLGDKYELGFVKNGRCCLESVNERLPDLILMDVNMPIMDGLEACSVLKNQQGTAHLPIVMLSALANEVESNDGLSTGASAYITKPFEEDLLLDTIQLYL
ncbi:MAG: response regulator [Cycloclasticus sp.]